MDNTVLNTISLCTGVAMLDEGVHAGLEYLGIRSRTVIYAEREAFPVSVLAARMEEGSLAPAPIWFGDFTELPARRFRGVVDGIVAGFPCQDLSVAGRRAGLDGKRSGLFFNVLDIADDSDAWFLLLENVAGIATATASVVDEEEGDLEERAASRVMGELADRGWNAEWITLSASDVGASHGRARWFCFAWRMAHAELPERRAQRVGGTGGVQGYDGGRAEENRGAGVAEQTLDNAHRPGAQRSGRAQQSSNFGCEKLVNPERARRTPPGSGCEIDAGREPEPRCSTVADAAGARFRGRQDAGTGGGNAQQGTRSIEPERGCAALADTDSARLQGLQRKGGADQDGREISYGSISERCGIFAPGPSDGRWLGLLARFPWLAPAITDEAAESLLRGVADGLASGLDFSYRAPRLRAGGNGVVPLCAATAVVVLVRRSGIFG